MHNNINPDWIVEHMNKLITLSLLVVSVACASESSKPLKQRQQEVDFSALCSQDTSCLPGSKNKVGEQEEVIPEQEFLEQMRATAEKENVNVVYSMAGLAAVFPFSGTQGTPTEQKPFDLAAVSSRAVGGLKARREAAKAKRS